MASARGRARRPPRSSTVAARWRDPEARSGWSRGGRLVSRAHGTGGAFGSGTMLWPAGETKGRDGSVRLLLNVLLNVIWLVLSGLWLAIAYTVAALICFILLITIPF